MYRADPTLYLAIAPGGSKSWIQRITIDGKRRDLGLGPFPVISLAKARERAFVNRVAIADRARSTRRKAQGSGADVPGGRQADL